MTDMASQPIKILITGSSGYVGHFLTNRLLLENQVDRNDGSNSSSNSNHSNRFFVYGCTFRTGPAAVPVDATCKALVMDGLDDASVAAAVAESSPDVVVNLMAIAAPVQCKKDPATARKLNVPTGLIEAMRAHCPAAMLVHLSTDMVYGSNSDAPHTEDAECTPVNVYGETKLAAEQLIRAEWPHHVILRASAIYGPRPEGRACTKLAGGSFLQFVRFSFVRVAQYGFVHLCSCWWGHCAWHRTTVQGGICVGWWIK